MAAIFERQSVFHEQPTTEFKGRMFSYALRQEPFHFNIGQATRPFYLSESLLHTTQADWLFTALDEITLRNAPPVWTKDEWIYTRVSMLQLPNTTTVSQDTSLKDIHSAKSGLGASPANVTVTTSALRSRLKCSNIPVPAGTGWLDRAEDVFSNRTSEPFTGWILPPVLFQDEEYRSPVFTVPRRMACCTNGTTSGGQSVVAFWSSSNPMTEQRPTPPVDPTGSENLRESIWTSNFTIKWIVGSTGSTVISGADPRPNNVQMGVGLANETLLYFTEQPQMSMMSCAPVIEHANASVTIARSTSQILQARLLTEPQSAPGAWDARWDNMYLHPAIDEAPTTHT
jgi:hypothetical protein